ncbi:amino acid adenylation domain-containing protein [Aldersonia sp. NBC_00410]|uniref:non-ribosomal peptide synthetase n=1 Tax=Aldersonia sp. NBC_00410 TaxID=2975954 RepID=UPI002252791D|nr:amino acid adenylation domain-containing protein [Aldersonia sp. NBC_00410]MCX5043512.1 amino acid adenylation domain-containing protein [Aldersonia sp. NBC_00410]
MSRTAIRDEVGQLLNQPGPAIGDAENLISLGLDSIRMMKLAGRWRKRGFDINFAQLAAEPTIERWYAALATEEVPAEVSTTPATEAASGDEFAPFPLAPMQHAYWIGRAQGQELGGVAAHLYVEFDGADVDATALEQAVERLVELHPMFRARFLPDGTQQILPAPVVPVFSVIDLRDEIADTVAQRLAQVRDEKTHQRMDVAQGQVLDIALTRLPSGASRLHVDVDMLAADAMSYRVAMTDLARLYAGEEIAPATYSYRRYRTEQPQADTAAHVRDRAWWHERLDDLPSAPVLPVLTASSDAAPHRTVRMHHWIDAAAKQRLHDSAHERGVTPAMALASVFAETIGGWSAESRFLLNLPLFHRDPVHPEIDRIVGDFTSSVLLDVDVRHPASVLDRALALQKSLHTNGSHAAYSGLEVLRDLGRQRGEQVLAPIVYTSALNLGELFDDRVTAAFGEPVWIVSQGPQVLLDAQVTEVGGGLLLNWDVRETAFGPGVVAAMFTHYKSAIERLTEGPAGWTAQATPQLPVDQLAVRNRVNATAGPTSGRCLHEGFFANAATDPDAPAVLWGELGEIGYGELARQSLALAGALRDRNVRAGDAVAVQLPKGPDQIVAALGILACGATYVPIGFDQPDARRARIFETADAVAAVGATADQFGDTGLPVVEIGAAISWPQPLARPVLIDPETPAYVLFTSGSTGTPKGVEVPHRAAMNTIDDLNDRFEVGSTDRALALSALEFDLSVYDIFGLLSAGGAVVTLDEESRADPAAWVELVRRQRVSVVNCVPGLLDMLLTAGGDELGSSLRTVLLGGDWVGADLPRRLARQVPGCRFAGLGGATETAIHSTVCEVLDPPADWPAVPYGTPLRNVACRVVDQRGNDCPDWVTGELWIGGRGVALGYRNDPARSAERFVPHDAQNWYRTGDLARYQSDGTLEFLGRADHRVKIRGYRVELGEVEGGLRSLPGVQAAVATLVGRRAPKLAAAVTMAQAEGGSAPLAAQLAELLPSYMVPSRIEILDRFPLTSNGKLDRKAIRALLEIEDEDGGFVAPRTELESALARIVGDVLARPRVGVADDFFSLGGDSVLATTVIARVRDWLDAPQAIVSDIFAARTVAALATRLADKDATAGRLDQVARIYLEIADMDEADLLADA